MRRKIPSTAALAAFESAARHQSFTQAAEELAVTQSAVCRQIAGLEDFLRVKLFRRTRRGVLLTEAGASYSRSVRARLDEVERDTLELMAKGGIGGSIEIAVVPTFATKWLLPRLPSFVQAHPGITVHMTPRTRPFLFDETVFDAALFAGDAGWPGTAATFLMHENLVAVGSPVLLGSRRRLKPAEIARLPLLQQGTRPYVWRQWFDSLGLAVENDLAGPRLELFSMLTEAAVHGMGAALIPPFLIEDELRSGRLVPLLEHAYRSDRSYYLIYPQAKSDNPALAVWRGWLEEQAVAYREA
ncbi:LysR family transcriptional regulator [Piscinibacter sp. XHJ-5]|uniref:LysR family transcriptional regulator n=1 Tax=Piscinibacter sp. XHJ-5 TaxID=3037797 RepID=UPI002452EDAC|nr:LysR family transcriptional regulator [Piscinibacter sp. XHJ-5]